jgi:glucosamine-6-phosphate deaminase
MKRAIREAEAVSGVETFGMTRSAGALPEPPVLPDGEGPQGPDRPERTSRSPGAPRGAPPGARVRGGRPLRPARHAPPCASRPSTGAGGVRSGPAPRCGTTAARGRSGPSHEADVLVPISEDELRRRSAIFKHQSQKDTAPFPGPRRARVLAARGGAQPRTTAAIVDRLGLPEYYAMEAFVVQPSDNGGALRPLPELADFMPAEL